jgi:hypothetical protein
MTARLIPIYTTKGDAEVFLLYPYIFNRNGEWVGFVTPQRDVYSVIGEYIGTLTNDPRIVRKRGMDELPPRVKPPAPPQKVFPPANVPLPPMMAELSHSVVDVLLDEPERLHTQDAGEFKEDAE